MGEAGVAVRGLEARHRRQSVRLWRVTSGAWDAFADGLGLLHNSKRAKKPKPKIKSFTITADCWRLTTRWGLKEGAAAQQPDCAEANGLLQLAIKFLFDRT